MIQFAMVWMKLLMANLSAPDEKSNTGDKEQVKYDNA